MCCLEEALHLASLLCKYGYFFHVAENNSTVVKEDGELYRFQAPYYWVSTNWNASNTDYAIYLLKRTMRNQEKHALNESEIRVLEDLKRKLTHQWDFIKMQADAQIKWVNQAVFLNVLLVLITHSIIVRFQRVLKDRKKADKTFIDSQERAFWNIMRPTVNLKN